MTREQLATLLYRLEGSPDVSSTNNIDNANSWAIDALNWSISQGLITGDTNGDINPTNTASRAEVATILMRYIAK